MEEKVIPISLVRDQVKLSKIGVSKVLVEVFEGLEKTSGGIIVPSQAQQERPVIGVIVNKGSEVTDYKVGQQVIFSHYSGVELKLKMRTQPSENPVTEKKFKLLTDIDIWGVVEKVEE